MVAYLNQFKIWFSFVNVSAIFFFESESPPVFSPHRISLYLAEVVFPFQRDNALFGLNTEQ